MNSAGKCPTVFNRSASPEQVKRDLPCGQCVGCRLERSRQWAIRCVHEASMYEHNCFITLTYDDAHVPLDGSLNLDHFQRFMKRLRKEYGNGIGSSWFAKYGSDVFPSDEVIVNGKSVRPPRFYDGLLDATDPELLETIKCIRVANSKFNSDERLLVKEQVKLASIKSLKRQLEVI